MTYKSKAKKDRTAGEDPAVNRTIGEGFKKFSAKTIG